MKRLTLALSALFILVLLLSPAFAQEKKATVAGSWKCSGQSGNQGFDFQLDLVQKGTEVTGTAARSDGSTDIQKGSFENGKLKLSIDADGGEYVLEATLDGDGLKGTLTHSSGIKGTWSGKRPGAAASSASANVSGSWKLLANMGGQTAEYKLELKQDKDTYTGSIFTPDGEAVPLTKVSFQNSVLKFTVSAPDGDYVVESKFDGKVIKGTFVTPSGEKGTFEATRT